jgi:tRNA modification GTPase
MSQTRIGSTCCGAAVEYTVNALAEDHVILLSPDGRGAVASLAVAGPNAGKMIARHVRRSGNVNPLSESSPTDRVFFGRWISAGDPANGAGEDVVVCRRGELSWEVHCHGGRAAVDRIRTDLAQAGCRSLSWREWIARREADPIRAAAISLLADAQTERTAAILLDQYHGAWERALAEIRENLAADRPTIAAAQIRSLLRLEPLAAHLVEPWRVVVVGPPNVGKSSLINALLGYQRTIVHDQPGTTRDAVSVQLAIDGWPVELVDTAGLRPSDDPLESAGIARALEASQSAHMLLAVFDATQPSSPRQATLKNLRTKRVVICNKCDLLAAPPSKIESNLPDQRFPGMLASATTRVGLDLLLRRLSEQLVPEVPAIGGAVPLLPVQIAQLNDALTRLETGDLAGAIDKLGD